MSTQAFVLFILCPTLLFGLGGYAILKRYAAASPIWFVLVAFVASIIGRFLGLGLAIDDPRHVEEGHVVAVLILTSALCNMVGLAVLVLARRKAT